MSKSTKIRFQEREGPPRRIIRNVFCCQTLHGMTQLTSITVRIPELNVKVTKGRAMNTNWGAQVCYTH